MSPDREWFHGIPAIVVVTGLLITSTSALAQPGLGTNINLVLTDMQFPGCETATWIEEASCSELVSPALDGPRIAWVVVSDPDRFIDGFSSLQFGVEHDIEGLQFLPCAGYLAIPGIGWPGSGSGIALAKTGSCFQPSTTSIRVGGFIIPGGATGQLAITPDARTGRAEAVDCTYLSSPICASQLGGVDVSLGGSPTCETIDIDPPRNLTVTTDQCPVLISWEYDGEDPVGFMVSGSSDLLPGSARAAADTNATSSPRAYRVAAVSECGARAWTEQVTGQAAPPAPPTNCQASEDTCAVRVTWDESPDAWEYAVQRKWNLPPFPGTWSTIATVPAGVSTYIDENAATDPAPYRIIAQRCRALSAPSNEDIGRRIPPPRILDLRATNNELCKVVELTWRNPEPVRDISVSRDGLPIAELPATAESYVDLGAVPGVEHEYEVRAVARCGNVARVVTGIAGGGPPPAPTLSSSLAHGCGTVVLEWTASEFATRYSLLRDGDAIRSLPGVSTLAVDCTIGAGETHTYVIVAESPCGDSEPSNEVTVEIPQEPLELPAPVPIAPADGYCASGDSITFSWHPVPGPAYYELYLGRASGGYSEFPFDTTLTLESSGQIDNWIVWAHGACCESPQSDVRHVLHDGNVVAPDSLRMTAIEGSTWRFDWAKVPGVSRYRLSVSSACHALAEMFHVVEVAGTDTTLSLDPFYSQGPTEPTTDFFAWVSAIACGSVGDSSLCVGSTDVVPVVLEEFRLTPIPGAVAATWRTGVERAIAGFHLDRESEGVPRTRITEAVIGAGTHAYAYTDPSVEPGRRYSYTLVEVDLHGSETDLARREVSTSAAPLRLAVRVHPNPANPSATVSVDIPESQRVVIHVLDTTGRRVRHLLDTRLPAGTHTITWDGRDDGERSAASGVYFVRVRTVEGDAVERLTLIR